MSIPDEPVGAAIDPSATSTAVEPAAGTTAVESAVPAKRNHLAAWLIVGAAVVMVAVGSPFIAIAIHHNSLRYQVAKACETSVRSQLKSPSTAHFSDEVVTDHYKVDKSEPELGKMLGIQGNVDADNSFGTPVRMSWTCSGYSDTATAIIEGDDGS